MNERVRKTSNQISRLNRTRSSIHGTATRPRLTVTFSLQHVSVQIINEDDHKTLAAATSAGKNLNGSLTQKAEIIGQEIAKKAQAAKIKKVVFDRGDKKYHGRIKVLAEAARKNGLEF